STVMPYSVSIPKTRFIAKDSVLQRRRSAKGQPDRHRGGKKRGAESEHDSAPGKPLASERHETGGDGRGEEDRARTGQIRQAKAEPGQRQEQDRRDDRRGVHR